VADEPLSSKSPSFVVEEPLFVVEEPLFVVEEPSLWSKSPLCG